MTALVVTATATIVTVRTYLAITGYPQIGGHSNLHIAHALFGGALMILALVLGCLFVGARARWIEIEVGGVGIGLFLDEVGKFVTKTNDYFYHPAAEIMYLTILTVVIGGGLVQAVHKPTVRERLVDVGVNAAEGMAFGLTAERMRDLASSLDALEAKGVDQAEVQALRTVLSRCDVHDSRSAALGRRLRALLPAWLKSRLLAAAAGWLMAITALQVALSSLIGLGLRPSQVLFEAGGGERVAAMSDRVYIVLGGVTFVCAVASLVRWHRGTTPLARVQSLRVLQATAVAFTVVGGVVDFAEFGGFALVSILVGVVTILLLRIQIGINVSLYRATGMN